MPSIKDLSLFGSGTSTCLNPSAIFSIKSTAAALPSISNVFETGPDPTKFDVIEYNVEAPCSRVSAEMILKKICVSSRFFNANPSLTF